MWRFLRSTSSESTHLMSTLTRRNQTETSNATGKVVRRFSLSSQPMFASVFSLSFPFSQCLRDHFSQLDFEVIDLVLNIGNTGGEGGGAQEDNKEQKLQTHAQKLAEKFRSEVVSKCSDEAVVFIYISGIQFPFPVSSHSSEDHVFGNPCRRVEMNTLYGLF